MPCSAIVRRRTRKRQPGSHEPAAGEDGDFLPGSGGRIWSSGVNRLELKVPPPAVALLVALAMWLAAYGMNALAFAVPERRAVSMALAALGIGISAAGTWSFWRVRTTVNPTRPEATTSLVATGVFRLTRNPMYLGLFLVLAGWAAHLANIAALAGPLLFGLYITRFQVLPEERVLAAKFGQDFEAYKLRTRRWI